MWERSGTLCLGELWPRCCSTPGETELDLQGGCSALSWGGPVASKGISAFGAEQPRRGEEGQTLSVHWGLGGSRHAGLSV